MQLTILVMVLKNEKIDNKIDEIGILKIIFKLIKISQPFTVLDSVQYITVG